MMSMQEYRGRKDCSAIIASQLGLDLLSANTRSMATTSETAKTPSTVNTPAPLGGVWDIKMYMIKTVPNH